MKTQDRMKPKLGDLAKDSITGFEGVVTAVTKWLTGCDSINLSPVGLNNDGEPRKSQHFDITRVSVVERGYVNKYHLSGKTIKQAQKTGGPSSLDQIPTG